MTTESPEEIFRGRYQAHLDTPDAFMQTLHAELETFNQPHVNSQNMDSASPLDVMKDIHRALYGNGKQASGLTFKMAEANVLLKDMIHRHQACRREVEDHLEAAKEEALRKRFGLWGMVHSYPKLCLIALLLLFLGASTVWSIILQERQLTKTESAITSLVEKAVDIKLQKSEP